MTEDDVWVRQQDRAHNMASFRTLRWPAEKKPRYKFTDRQMQIALRSLNKKASK